MFRKQETPPIWYVSVRRSDDGDEFAAELDMNHNSDENPHNDHNTDDE